MDTKLCLRLLALCAVITMAMSGMYFTTETRNCMHNGEQVKTGEMFKPDVCTDCKCDDLQSSRCVRMNCGALICEDDKVSKTKEGVCCPECVPKE